ncbi:MAG: MCE family protein [Deltaproteobacteria bacterium]|jgi:phospholipid/cholesterol/gamma-HCH transport system substrate-binding protein|nr:MCE family protein [Deltaproteobacteria bacterium]MBW2537596.1 MCE family protein [Deltaproteobacteria bacterium]
MASPRSIEVKVGFLILLCLALLAGMVLVMGGISFEPTYTVLVGFDDPGGLQSGAPVKIAGVQVGKVDSMEFVGGGPAPEGDERLPMVRARVHLEKRYDQSIRDNSVFYITTQGVLGEQFLAIEPGTGEARVLEDGDSIRGLDPPRLDRMVAEAYDLLTTTVQALREHRPAIRDALNGLAKTLRGTGKFMENNEDRLDRIAANAEQISIDGVETLRAAKRQYVDNPQIERIISNADRVAGTAARDVPPLLTDGRAAVADARRVVNAVGSEEEIAKIKTAVNDVATVASDAKAAMRDARVIVAHVRRGRGSVGALVMDEQLFDDLQEMARDLKHNPWKFFWKE